MELNFVHKIAGFIISIVSAGARAHIISEIQQMFLLSVNFGMSTDWIKKRSKEVIEVERFKLEFARCLVDFDFPWQIRLH